MGRLAGRGAVMGKRFGPTTSAKGRPTAIAMMLCKAWTYMFVALFHLAAGPVREAFAVLVGPAAVEADAAAKSHEEAPQAQEEPTIDAKSYEEVDVGKELHALSDAGIRQGSAPSPTTSSMPPGASDATNTCI